MFIVEDKSFVQVLFKRYSSHRISDADVGLCQIEIEGNSGRGLKISVVHNLHTLITLGWWTEYGTGAAWPIACMPLFRGGMSRRDDQQLTNLVQWLLQRHKVIGLGLRSMFEVENELDKVALEIRLLGETIARQDWTAARFRWAGMSRLHPLLLETYPEVAFIDAVLKQNELASGPAVGGIH